MILVAGLKRGARNACQKPIYQLLCVHRRTISYVLNSRGFQVSRDRRPRPQIDNLDPQHVKPGDFADLSNLKAVGLGCFNGTDFPTTDLRYTDSNWASKSPRFPSNAKGFFYFHRPKPPSIINEQGEVLEKALCPAAGSVRFRVVSEEAMASGALEAFQAGHDLLSPSGIPWKFPLLALRTIPKYRPIYDLLLRPSPSEPSSRPLISVAQDKEISKILPKDFRCKAHSTVLDTVLDPFSIDFTTRDVVLTILDTEDITKVHLRRVTARSDLNSPYSGIGLVRLELRPNPNELTQLRVFRPQLVLRLLKYLRRPDSKRSPYLREGDLVRAFSGFNAMGDEDVATWDPEKLLTKGMIELLKSRSAF